MITVKDIEEAITEANTWALKWGEKRDLHPRGAGGNATEGAAIADGMLSGLLGVEEQGLTEWIDHLTSPAIAELVIRAATKPQGVTRFLMATMGSIFLSGLTAGIMLGRKFPKP